MANLPVYAVLQSRNTGKYLEFVREDGELHGFLRFSADQPVSPCTKFQFEFAKKKEKNKEEVKLLPSKEEQDKVVVVDLAADVEEDKSLVHVRSCYNGKYWVASQGIWIVNGADAPEQDQSKPSCTLFKPSYDGGAKTLVLTHVNLGKYITSAKQPGQGKDGCLCPQSSEEAQDVFIVTDWSSLGALLPSSGLTQNVVSRRIDNVKFHMEDARIANSTWGRVTLPPSARNEGDQVAWREINLRLAPMERVTGAWSSTANGSLNTGDRIVVRSGVPVVLENGVMVLSGEIDGSIQWGVERTTWERFGEIHLQIPPRTFGFVNLVQPGPLEWEVPFSYTQIDTMENGVQVTYQMNDGIFKGTKRFVQTTRVFDPIPL